VNQLSRMPSWSGAVLGTDVIVQFTPFILRSRKMLHANLCLLLLSVVSTALWAASGDNL
jgi:hypothetical protein